MSYLDSIISDISYVSIPFGQKYKIFLIYFSGIKWQNCTVRICSVSDTLCRQSSPAAVPIYPARPVWYRVQTGAACPASGRVCRGVVCCGHGLPCIWHGLCCCLCCAVRPGAPWAGVSTSGVYGESRVSGGRHLA